MLFIEEIIKKDSRDCGPSTASHWWTQEDTCASVLLSLKDNWSCLLLNDFSSPLSRSPLSLSLTLSFFLSPLFLLLIFSLLLAPSLHLLDSLPHQLFSSHTEMTPQGNVILCVRVHTHTQNAYALISHVLYSATSTKWHCPLLWSHSLMACSRSTVTSHCAIWWKCPICSGVQINHRRRAHLCV